MNSDTDALAAYAEAWKPGDPLPAGMEIEHNEFDGSTYTWIRYGGCYQSVESWILNGCPDWQTRLLAQMAQSLTGVLVVELAMGHIDVCLMETRDDEWVVFDVSHPGDGGLHVRGPTPLCALVAAWMEVNK